ncbi:MAG: LysR family transcriptional regulator [Pseudomonadota bacterium]
MNWDDLRIFLALCREGSVSGAGRVLGLNHTTVARRVRALEGDLQTRLFDRTRDGYAMTQAAENMYGHALRMEERAQAIDRDVFGRDAALEGPLKLTVPYDFANKVLIPSLRAFRARYPQIELQLLTTTDMVDLAAREADIAVRLTQSPPDYLVGRAVLPLRHGIYGARHYLEQRAAAGTPPDVILFRDDPVPEWVKEHFPNARTCLRIDNVSTMRAAVAAGLGLARIPCVVADDEGADDELRRLDLPLPPSDWKVWVLNHVDLRSTARVRVTRDYLQATIAAKGELILGERSVYWEGDAY